MSVKKFWGAEQGLSEVDFNIFSSHLPTAQLLVS